MARNEQQAGMRALGAAFIGLQLYQAGTCHVCKDWRESERSYVVHHDVDGACRTKG
jgi:hypothetical protein